MNMQKTTLGLSYDRLQSDLSKGPQELQKVLEDQLSALRGWISDRNEAFASDGELHLGPSSSPLSIYSRVKGARTALLGECEKLSRLRSGSLQGSVELYWLSKAMDSSLEVFWASLDVAELAKRENLCDEVANRFASLIPPSMFRSFEKALESPGALAVAVAEAQGHNAELAMRLRELQDQETQEEQSRLSADIASSNMEAAGTLAEFEWGVLSRPPPYPSMGGGDGSPLTPSTRGFAQVNEARLRYDELRAQGNALEADLSKVKIALSRGIDLLERLGPHLEAERLLSECKKVCVGALDT